MKKINIKCLFACLALGLVSCDLLMNDEIKDKYVSLFKKFANNSNINLNLIDDEDDEEYEYEYVYEDEETANDEELLQTTTNNNMRNDIALSNSSHDFRHTNTRNQANVSNQTTSISQYNTSQTSATKTENSNSNKIILNNRFDDSTFKTRMQPILDAIMKKLIETEKVTQAQRQLIKQLAGRKYNSNYKEILIANTSDKEIIQNLNEALQLLSNEEQTQPMSIKKVYNEANKSHTKSIMGLRPGEAKKYGAPRPATLAYSKVIELLNYIIYTTNKEDKFSSGKYGYTLFIINEIKDALDQLKYAINEHDLIVKKDTNTAEVYQLKNDLNFLIDRYHISSYYK